MMNDVIEFPPPTQLKREAFSDLLESINNRGLRIYCTEQIRCAKTQAELSAAIHLVEEIAWGMADKRLPNGTGS